MAANFMHSCELCRFLGVFVNEDGETVDLYVHVDPDEGETVAQSYLVRYGDEGSEYCSIPSFMFVDDASLIEAEARSLQRGIRSRVLGKEE